MQILSAAPGFFLVPGTSQAWPLPVPVPGNKTPATAAVFVNLGPANLYVALGSSAGVVADSTSTFLPASFASVPVGQTVDPATYVGPSVSLPLSPGQTYFASVAAPTTIAVATTQATASSDSTTATVASATNIAPGQTVSCITAGILQDGTVVSSIAGTTVTLSLPTLTELNDFLQFSIPANPPGLLCVGLVA